MTESPKSGVENTASSLALSYPFDWNGLESFSYPLDSNGIPRVDLGRRLGLRYNPITVAQFGLFNLQRFVRNDDQGSLTKALTCASWLADGAQKWRSGTLAWVYDYDLDFYGPKAPWISAMAQGQAISLLLRAYPLKRNDRWLEVTKQAIGVFFEPVENGGVATTFPDGATAFEEFPTQPASLVLNGNMFAILGILDYATYWHDSEVTSLFDQAIHGLKRNLHRYDTGYWNRYDLHPTNRLASPMYVEVHVRLLRALAELIDEPIFAEFAERWCAYVRSPVSRIRWFLGKALEKVRLAF